MTIRCMGRESESRVDDGVVMEEARRAREIFGDTDALYVDADGNLRPKCAKLSKSGGKKTDE